MTRPTAPPQSAYDPSTSSLLDGHDRQAARAMRPRRYGLWARWTDRREARRDARAGLPYLDEERPDHVRTASCDVLVSQGQAAFDTEWMLLQEDLHRLAGRLHDARHRLSEAAADVAAARQRLDNAPPPEPTESARVRGGEEHTTPAIRADRREREHDARVADGLAELSKAQKRLSEAASEEATVRDAQCRRIRIAQARARQLGRYTQMRISAYWRWLVRRHPDGGRINALVVGTQPFGPPAWAEMTPDDITTFLQGLDHAEARPAGDEAPPRDEAQSDPPPEDRQEPEHPAGDAGHAEPADGGVHELPAPEPERVSS